MNHSQHNASITHDTSVKSLDVDATLEQIKAFKASKQENKVWPCVRRFEIEEFCQNVFRLGMNIELCTQFFSQYGIEVFVKLKQGKFHVHTITANNIDWFKVNILLLEECELFHIKF